ncbi:tetratricopeptide repeat protein [Hymenobacter busanensis]|uniref:Tetratricopeptide repeat protein n=1 Tax=Hymenobacter busanensis TaxID=2607656 RepID=A0A7L4ZXQ2_9BACT|nr:tetratricopeptide repeat protein [Hymenobacter busanensis]KAA9333041.1 tetratricopeptide repeat protein [Hymenobacter busanensis]QHJ08284.1 tetratricopeptide repeat protein [Hymenobacter busanensis]
MSERQHHLAELFLRLRMATAPLEVEALQQGIWQLWLELDDVALSKRLEAGMRDMAAGEYSQAIAEFTFLIKQLPEYAEGWNKRATAYYLRGEYRSSLNDIAQTLKREPRHFGALSGKATIQRMLGDQRGALRTLRRLARLCPHLPGLQEQLRDVQDRLDESL